MLLELSGFEVLQAEDGVVALEIFQEKGDSIDCVLLDFSMPRLNGEETFRELRKIQPDVRVVLCSGYTELEILERFGEAGFAGFVKKPSPSRVLIDKLTDAIENP